MIVAATGFFDGVHIGHRMVIEKTCSLARSGGGRSLIVTFWPHPRAVLQSDAEKLRLLNSLEEKKRLCTAMGIDDFVVLPFTRQMGEMTATEFIDEYLVGRYGVSSLVLGYDHHLGSGSRRDPQQLAREVESCGITPIRVVESVTAGGISISSTLIRGILAGGDVALAAKYLGYNYPLTGVVVSGNRIGRTIGFPTANISLREPLKVIPKPGVYSVTVHSGGRRHIGICNIGTRPTLDDGRGLTIETHILDFDEDIYGLDISIEFIDRIRDEVRFDSLEELRVQLAKDKDLVSKSQRIAYICRNNSDLW